MKCSTWRLGEFDTITVSTNPVHWTALYTDQVGTASQKNKRLKKMRKNRIMYVHFVFFFV